MTAPIVTCARCGRERRHQARGLCHSCYSAAYRDGTATQYPPRARKGPAADTTHGTTRGWAWHRRAGVPICPACRHAHNKYKQWRDLRRAEGHPGYVDAAPVLAHIEHLRALGMSVRSISTTAGLGSTTLAKIVNGGVSTVRAATAAKVLTVTGPPAEPARPDDETFVPRVGTVRRIQALQALGWRHADISAAAGVVTHLLLSQAGPYVTVRTRAAVARAYDELSMRLGPSGRTRARAAAKGWAPPLAWNDEDLDDPHARFDLGGVLDGRVRVEDVEWLAGAPATEVAARLGVTTSGVAKAMYRAGRPDLAARFNVKDRRTA